MRTFALICSPRRTSSCSDRFHSCRLSSISFFFSLSLSTLFRMLPNWACATVLKFRRARKTRILVWMDFIDRNLSCFAFDFDRTQRRDVVTPLQLPICKFADDDVAVIFLIQRLKPRTKVYIIADY